MKVYVINNEANDYLAVFNTAKEVGQELTEILLEDEGVFIEPKDIANQIKTREKNGCYDLFFPDLLDEGVNETDYRVRVTYLKNKKA